jgi:hypothetical protein
VHILLLPSPLLLPLHARLNACSCAIQDPPGEGFLLVLVVRLDSYVWKLILVKHVNKLSLYFIRMMPGCIYQY